MPLEKLNLTDNPFKFLTPSEQMFKPENPLWAGLPEVKSKIDAVYSRVIKRGARSIVLNWGPYGGGKTFAANYFTRRLYPGQDGIYQVYIRSPKEGSSSVDNFYRSVLESISISSVREQIGRLVDSWGDKQFYSFMRKRIQSEEFAKALLLLGSSTDSDTQETLRRFLFSTATKTDLKKIGIARPLQDEMDKVKALVGILLCFVSDGSGKGGRLFIWLDEMEDLIYYSAKQYKIFSQAMRDLVDSLSENFGLFLNFTLSEPEQNTIELVLGSALWSRITNKIRFDDLNITSAKLYLHELIAYYQKSTTGDFTPFDEASVDALLSIVQDRELTPREINKTFGEFLEYCLERDYEMISVEKVQEWKKQLGSET